MRLLRINLDDWEKGRVRKLYLSSSSIRSGKEPRTIDLGEGQTLEATVEAYLSVSAPGLSGEVAQGELQFDETFAGALKPVPFTAYLILPES